MSSEPKPAPVTGSQKSTGDQRGAGGKRRNGGAPRQLWVLMMMVFVDMMGALIIMPLLPYYAENFQGDGVAIGLLTSVFAAAQMFSALIWGWLSDRYGRRPILLASLIASAIAYVFFGLSVGLWMLFVSRILQGVGAGTIGVVQAYVADSVGVSERSGALGWTTAAASAGVTIGPLIGSALSPLGYEAPGLFAAGLCLLNFIFAWHLLPESSTRREPGEANDREPLWRSTSRVIVRPANPVSSLIWIYTLAMTGFMALNAMMALYLFQRFGITDQQIGFFYTLLGAVSVIMRAVVMRPIVDRIGEPRAMRVGALCMAVGLLLLPLASKTWIFLLLMPLVPIGTALLFPVSTSLLSQRSDQAVVGQTLGVQQFFRGIAGMVGPGVAGAVYEASREAYLGTEYASLSLGAPFFLSGSIMVLVALGTLFIQKQTAAIQQGAAIQQDSPETQKGRAIERGL